MASPQAPPAPTAAVYEAACHALAISARAELRALLTKPEPPAFRTSRISFPDPHAVALAVALLARHGAPAGLLQRFLASWSSAATASPLPPTTVPPTVCYGNRARSKWVAVDFSGNELLSPRGAAAILAACLLLPTGSLVELSLDDCADVSSLTLRPWLPLLSSEPRRGALVGLRLDACPLRSLDVDTLRSLRDLRWISLRYTAISNLWRCAEILVSLPKLAAALMSGTESPRLDQVQLDDMREFCRKAMHAIGFDAGNVASHALTTISTALDRRREAMEDVPFSYIVPPTNHPAKAALLVSQQESALLRYGERQRMARSQTVQAEATLSAAVDLLYASHMAAISEQGPHVGRSFAAPVVLNPRFWDFMLAKTKDSLKSLDGVKISRQKRKEAKRKVSAYFEDVAETDGTSRGSSVLALLRHREVGFSRSNGRSRRAGATSAELHQKKRRRTTEFSPKVADIMATVAAAGFPAVPRAGGICPSANIRAALRFGAVNSESGRPIGPAVIGTVDMSALERSSSPDSDEGVRQTPVTSFEVAANSDHRTRRRFLRAGYRVYHEGDFEASMSATLIRRQGAPRIQYLHQWQDRPRQFEHNPSKPSELVYGTEDGYVVLIDQESGEVKGSCLSGGGLGSRPTGQVIPQTSDLNSLSSVFQYDPMSYTASIRSAPVYGLSWLNRRGDMFLSGTNDGAIHVYNVNWMRSGERGGCVYACETFDGLTSLHVSSDDVRFAVSGNQRHVGLFDLETGRRTELMRACHTESINVVKFAHISPHILVTASFDRYMKKWDLRESRPGGERRPIFQTRSKTDNLMACFSPDDSRLLVSAIDNEVRQYLAADGRLEREYNIPNTGSCYNYTRSYYMNDRDYIITGSSMEHVVRVYNARTGAFFSEIDMDNRETVGGRRRLCVQTLRANPGRRFNFTALLAANPANPGPIQGLIATADLHRR